MLNANGHKNFTASQDKEAEMLLSGVLAKMKETLDGTPLCVVLGGSYGRGEGGVRQDRENGIIYNDLDFFVFAERKMDHAESLLQDIARKYEKELQVDVDFSPVTTVKQIKKNARRLMMQELKRGYKLVAGRDLLAQYLPELPAEKLPFSEACRLLFNRGMGLLMAGEKIKNNSPESDFIMRNICKALLGCGDAILIAGGEYRWRISERMAALENSDLPEKWKALYREAVEFKYSPHRQLKPDMIAYWQSAAEFFRAAVLRTAAAGKEDDLPRAIGLCCKKSGEVSLKNLLIYCVKTHSLPLTEMKRYMAPAVAGILPELYRQLDKLPVFPVQKSKLYQLWLIFN